MYILIKKKIIASEVKKSLVCQKNITLHKRIKDKIKDEYNLNIY